MKVQLRVVRGSLRNRHGNDAGSDIQIPRARFLIGTSPECHMCCRSETVSPRHCELQIGEFVSVRDLESHSGTFVNDVQISDLTRLVAGDRLRVGRLEFEVMVLEDEPDRRQGDVDPMSEFVSEMLDEADAEDRARRMSDPLSRKFDVQAVEPDSAAADEEAPDDEPRGAEKKPPGKLPQPPERVPEDTVQAAAETLQKIFDRPKSRK